MWKIIIIFAVVFILGGSWIFYKNQEAMVMKGGEVETVLTQYDDVISRAREMKRDEIVRTYATLRERHFSTLSEQLVNEKNGLDREREETEQEIADTQEKIDTADQQYQSLQEELANYTQQAAELVGLGASNLDFDVVTQKISDLLRENDELRASIDREDRTIADLTSESERLSTQISEQKKLAQDRQARLSPPDLECRVSYVDPNWGFVRLDAGINKGIVIGSRLAIMRGDVKICEINVTNVETRAAAGEVVRSTLMTAESVKPGDRVISVRNNN
ncbi:MAG TPA: hypothetical protein H9976_07110 [Candidatus Akkermansia intestinavium]|nr:hypothetical protein [Candidatus Akkermansia intestinavium]